VCVVVVWVGEGDNWSRHTARACTLVRVCVVGVWVGEGDNWQRHTARACTLVRVGDLHRERSLSQSQIGPAGSDHPGACLHQHDGAFEAAAGQQAWGVCKHFDQEKAWSRGSLFRHRTAEKSGA
jgi:hypothetical protein